MQQSNYKLIFGVIVHWSYWEKYILDLIPGSVSLLYKFYVLNVFLLYFCINIRITGIYIIKLLFLQKSHSEDKSRPPASHWPGSHYVRYQDREAVGLHPDIEQQRRTTNGCVSTSSSPGIPNISPSEPTYLLEASHSPPRGLHGYPYSRMSPRMSPVRQPHSPPPPDDQPLNLSTETTLCASQQQLINNIVDRMCGAPSINSANSDNRSDVPRFFRPENLNNNNNEIEKPAFHKAIDARINGMCDVSLIVSKTIDYVIDRAYDDEKDKKEKLLGDNKGPVTETKSNSLNNGASGVEADKSEEVESDKGKGESKETVSSSSGSNTNNNTSTNGNNTNGVPSPNTRPRKRVKEDSFQENHVPHKKVRYMLRLF